MRRYKSLKNHIKKAALLVGAAFLFWSCEEKVVEDFGELNRNFSDRTTINAHVIRKDSGYIRLDLKSPLIQEFTLIDSPYTLMPKGLKLKFWNSHSEKPNFLRADWAKINDKNKFYEGKGHVLMINNDGDTLKTNHIFWDNLNRKIYTKDTVTIVRKDSTTNISDHGLEASEDFKEFTLYKNHGVINPKSNSPKKKKGEKTILPKENKKPLPLQDEEKNNP